MPPELPLIDPTRKSGTEVFHNEGRPRDFPLGDFWSWSASDLVSNATRGVLAEYIVGLATGAFSDTSVRSEWDAFDLTTPSGVKVEVKSSAYVQSWYQNDYSAPSFSVRKAHSWDAETNEVASQPVRAADVYVFALLGHKDQATIDPLNLSQWEFFVVPTSGLDERERSQHTITLDSLREEFGPSVGFDKLASAVEDAS